MLKIEHLTILHEQQHLFQDVSLSFNKREVVSICADSMSEVWLAHILAGNIPPQEGTLTYDCTTIQDFKEEELRLYRYHYATFLFSDFQMTPARKVMDTIRLSIQYDPAKFKKIMSEWDLNEIRDARNEELTFKQQMRVVLARTQLKNPSLLVVYPDSTPFSKEERLYVYELLKQMVNHCTIIIVGDQDAQAFATRRIEIQNGHVLSDSAAEECVEQAFVAYNEVTLSEKNLHYLLHKQNEIYRWAYRAMKFTLMLSLLFLSIFVFTESLNIVDMQMDILHKNGQDAFTIEKVAQGNDGKFYPNEYALMSEKDVLELNEHSDGNISIGSTPIDQAYANSYLEGVYDVNHISTSNKAVVFEADSKEILGLPRMLGRYPTNFDEVAISYEIASDLLKSKGLTSYKELLNQELYWYGLPLRITAIFTEENYNLAMTSLQNSLFHNLTEGKLYVKKGFLKQHPLQKLKSFPLSYKRILVNNMSISLSAIYTNEEGGYYSDGTDTPKSLNSIQENEVVLNPNLAIQLGFPYQEVVYDDNLNSEEKMIKYNSFIKEWVDKEITLQAYTILSSPTNSTMYRNQVKIKGFILPSYEMMEGSLQNQSGNIYLSSSSLQKEVVNSIAIESVYYHSAFDKDIKGMLSYLASSDIYEAHLPQSNLFQFCVVDMKGLSSFLLISGSVLFGICLYVFLLLQYKTKERLKKDMSIYYAFGKSKTQLQGYYRKNAATILWKGLRTSTLISIAILSSLILIVLRLSSRLSILFYLFLPCIFAIGIFIVFNLGLYICLKKFHLLDEAFDPTSLS